MKSSLLSQEESAWISESLRTVRDMSVWRGRDPLNGSMLRHCEWGGKRWEEGGKGW